ncbi:MAG: hypothetical protein ACXITV_09210 [Luteibaculaceae bacterium]
MVILENIARFVLLLLLQVFVFNHFYIFDGLVVLHIFILFILLLPFSLGPLVLLLLGFSAGILADFFTGTMGLQASAFTALAGARLILVKNIAPRDGYEINAKPLPQFLGWGWFLTYVSILTLFYYTWLFTVENFSFALFYSTVLKILLSTAFTIIFIASGLVLFSAKKN